MPFDVSRFARPGILLLLLSAGVSSSAANSTLKMGQKLLPRQMFDCCNKSSIYLEIDKDGGIGIWKYGNRAAELIKSSEIPRFKNEDHPEYHLALSGEGQLVATMKYDDDGTTRSRIYWRSEKPAIPGKAINSESYVQLTADKSDDKVRLELVTPGGSSPVVTALTEWK